jgi:hypothetical protein
MNHSHQQCRPLSGLTTYTSDHPGVMTNSRAITLEQLFRYYKGLPHQAASIALLEEDLAANGYKAAMQRDREWFATWSQSGNPTGQP